MREHKNQIERFYGELWNRWDFRIVGEVLTEDILFRGSLGATTSGHAGFIEYAESVRSVFPDFHNTIKEMIAEDDKVAARLSYRGTHRGELFGIPPTGRCVVYSGMAIFSFRQGRISNIWVLGDRLELLTALQS